jgi:enoyl-CoA hydratase/carnithine racemase
MNLPFRQLLAEVDGGICTLTLNRPAKRNALTATLVNELIVALEAAGSDDAIRVIVLTGAGNSFCAGGDLSQLQGGAGPQDGRDPQDGPIPWRGGFVELNLAFAALGKPTIAKIRRHALAGGLGLVCACTFALAEDTATFATPEIDLGLFPMMIMANIFRVVPRRQGLELILTGARVDAMRATEMGLITRAVPADMLDQEVTTLARTLAAKPPQVLRLGLEAFHRQADMDLAAALPYLGTQLQACLATDDAQEGLSAFLEKRKPRWA